MPLDPSLIGHASPVAVFDVEKGAIRAFAQAIGDPNPLYRDEEFARANGYRSLVAPPTMTFTFRPNPIPDLDLPAVGRVHADQEINVLRPVCAGDVVHVTSTLVAVVEREGKLGKMTFVTFEVTGTDPAGQLFYRNRNTTIVIGGGGNG